MIAALLFSLVSVSAPPTSFGVSRSLPLPAQPTLQQSESEAGVDSWVENWVDNWAQAWALLSRLRNLELDQAERVDLRAKLETVLSSLQGSGTRLRILSQLLSLWDGETPPALSLGDLGLATDLDESDLHGQEHWFLAEVLVAGERRATEVQAGLLEAPLSLDSLTANRRLNLAWTVGVAEARAGRHRSGALPIQTQLYRDFPGAWSAMDLALTLSLLGEGSQADAVLESEISREASAGGQPEGVAGWVDPELWNQRGLVALGLCHERRARDYFGRALRLGSQNATIVLARLDLIQGKLEGARRGFRSLSWGDDPGAWTQRGYGLSMLPPRPTSSTTGLSRQLGQVPGSSTR